MIGCSGSKGCADTGAGAAPDAATQLLGGGVMSLEEGC